MQPGPVLDGMAASAAVDVAVDVERWFEAHHRMVFQTAYRVTGSASDAEDALQTVFLKALRRAPQAEPPAHVESYLRRAAVNAALDLLRSRQAAAAVPLEELAFALPANAAQAPDRALAASEIRQWLRQTVARLSARAAEIFVLRFYEDKPTPEIAHMLGMSEASVAVTLSRARGRIEKEYAAYSGGRKGH